MAIFLRTGWRFSALGLALFVGLGLAAPSPDAEARRRFKKRTARIGEGVKLTRLVDRRGPNRIKILTVDLAAPTTLDTVLSRNKLPRFERTSSMARRSDAIAAINGDYGRPSGRPVHTFASDGHLAQTELSWGRNFAVDADETQAFMGHPQRNGWVRDDTGVTHEYRNRVNQGPANRGQIARFTPQAGGEERPPEGTCMARVLPQESPRTLTEGAGIESTHVVHKVSCPSSTSMWPRGGSILQAPLDGTYGLNFLGLMEPGEQVILGWSLGWPGVRDTIGGNPTLIEEGEVARRNVTGTGSFFARHPRTGVGYSSDTGEVFLAIVDGRRKGSVGMTLKEFAAVFKRLGAEWALNLDGGGSTTMVVDGAVVNKPSDKNAKGRRVERAVSSSIVILPGDDPDDPGATAGTAQEGGLPANDAVAARRAMRDGASIGGLASYLRSLGRRLPPSLRRAADAFEASR